MARAVIEPAVVGNAPPLVLVEWVDSSQPAPQWQWLDSVITTTVRCITVGFLISDSGDVTVVAQNVGDSHGERQVSGVITIPVRSVTRITKLAATTSTKKR